MFKPLMILTVSAVLLTSCSTVRDSRVNPMNWFGGARSQPVAVQNPDSTVNPLIPAERRFNLLGAKKAPPPYVGQPIATVSELLIERRAGGAIIRASGIADRQGPFDVRLVPVPDQPGTLSYTLSALQTNGPRDTNDWSRTVTAALWLTDQELAGVSTIRVIARSNEQTARR
ncbi:hypothetical protein P775_26410 [Puniceibacterium antarcticum]|uniref:Lipoprotein n=1 Tax=Puniceibacterium antarcticum TaxID=1206336 RepID=A0A2G8QZW7_9RHOB|nr:hypothetical protein [Puniceibacterium antarcticum]PIL14840.1 hypothetical protein P775_26410 [Puniceibacterium antarcticum]